MIMEWRMESYDFETAIEHVQDNIRMDFPYPGYWIIGRLNIGYLSFEFVACDAAEYDVEDETGIFMIAEIYVGGDDSGYSYTFKGNLPYNLVENMDIRILNIQNVGELSDFEMFKKHCETLIVSKIIESERQDLIEKMNMDHLFDWS